MARKIALLPDEAINQIAAGEVVENPASVVKELLDNALDAGASRISIEIQAGGHQSILIEDNGCGMSREDAELSLLRHATSKIRGVSDLDSLSTMGFRGEALAAIASVSKLEVRTSDGNEATRIAVEGGRVLAIEPCARNPGTTMAVSSLFYNAPARRKFQKSPQASAAAIVRVVESLAIAHPNIAFSLCSQGETLLDVKPSGLQERILEVLGDAYALGLWFDEGEVKGILGRPEEAKATRSGQLFFLNKRPIFAPLLSRALKDGYGTRIGTGAYPLAVLFFELNPTEFDVNVHPQKREVRFRSESALFSKTVRTVQRVFLPKCEKEASSFVFLPERAPFSFSSRQEPLFFELPPPEMQRDFLAEEPSERPLMVLGTFLLLERQGKLIAADLGDASEEKAVNTSEKQALLFPIECSLSLEESQMADELLEHLTKGGLDVRMVGPRRYCIDAAAEWIDPGKVELFGAALKEGLLKGIPADAAVRRLVRRFSKPFTLEEAAALWRQKRIVRQMCIEPSDLEKLFVKP